MIKQLLKNDIIVLDGAMGTMLMDNNLPIGKKPEMLNIDNPKLIQDIHYKYLQAGADIIYTNTFGANKIKMNDCDYKAIITAAIANAKVAVEKAQKGYIALDMGSLGKLMQPIGDMSFEQAYECYKEIVLVAKDSVDLFVVETISDLLEAKAAVLAIKENSDLAAFVTMSFDQDGRTFSGCPIEAMIVTLEGLGVDAIGLNCSLGPMQLQPLVDRLIQGCSVPIILKPNAGLPTYINGATTYDVDCDNFAGQMSLYVKQGVKIVGGCCGTNNEYIAKLVNQLQTIQPAKTSGNLDGLASSTKFVDISQPRIIGERINPTGKKLMKQAILDKDFNYFCTQAVEQVEAGADILDINMGLPNIDEQEMMVGAIQKIAQVVDAPLQIDSSDSNAIQAALRIYGGKPIVNSVNGDYDVLDKILPLVKKYGAMVIGLTLDKNGVPKTAQERIDVAQKILDRATFYGIKKKDIIIDCLTLTVGAEQIQAEQTLEAMHYIKNVLKLKTALGISNISFGLPCRELVNQGFLLMALTQGLDLPIINPNIAENMQAIYIYRLIKGIDKNATDYIEKFSIESRATAISNIADLPLKDCIIKSLDSAAIAAVKSLLKTVDGLEIIDKHVIPALNVVGEEYENKRMFLPQLISSSETAKIVCNIIKQNLSTDKIKDKHCVMLATVEGDVHDIGKNIVKTVLENYGYKVIDLGRDVKVEEVVKAVTCYHPRVLGLSALMTTTVANMQRTISQVRLVDKKIVITVGGAVLTRDIANQIGADSYSKDPRELVRYLELLD